MKMKQDKQNSRKNKEKYGIDQKMKTNKKELFLLHLFRE